MQTKTANRSAGRPRRHGVEETVLAAAVALAGDEGYAGATVDAVAARAHPEARGHVDDELADLAREHFDLFWRAIGGEGQLG